MLAIKLIHGLVYIFLLIKKWLKIKFDNRILKTMHQLFKFTILRENWSLHLDFIREVND